MARAERNEARSPFRRSEAALRKEQAREAMVDLVAALLTACESDGTLTRTEAAKAIRRATYRLVPESKAAG